MGANLNLSGLDQFKASALLAERAVSSGAPMVVDLELIDFDPRQPRRTSSMQAAAAGWAGRGGRASAPARSASTMGRARCSNWPSSS
jgi:hypothetical protein